MSSSLKLWVEPRASWNHCPGAWAVPELQRVVRLPSMALAGRSALDWKAVGVQPVRDRTVSPDRLAEQLAPPPPDVVVEVAAVVVVVAAVVVVGAVVVVVVL